jgi:hypothetical protein
MPVWSEVPRAKFSSDVVLYYIAIMFILVVDSCYCSCIRMCLRDPVLRDVNPFCCFFLERPTKAGLLAVDAEAAFPERKLWSLLSF